MVTLIIFLVAFVIVMTAAMGTESPWWATLFLILGAFVGAMMVGFQLALSFIKSVAFNPYVLIGVILAYLIVGILWSFYKWYLYVKNDGRDGNDKTKITGWIFYWPFSMLSYFVYDMLRDFGRWIVRRLGGVYDAITAKAIAARPIKK